jgi:aldehyde dehydrogenase (NAD+)
MTTREIFDTMDYGPAPESDAEVRAWIANRGPAFGPFIDGAFQAPGETFATRNPANGEVLAQVTQGTASDPLRHRAPAPETRAPLRRA